MVANRKSYSWLDLDRVLYHPFGWDALWELLGKNVMVLLNQLTQFFPVTYGDPLHAVPNPQYLEHLERGN